MTLPVIYTENYENLEYKHWASKTINFFCMWMRSTNSADISLIGRDADPDPVFRIWSNPDEDPVFKI